jgi:hypothetical protein
MAAAFLQRVTGEFQRHHLALSAFPVFRLREQQQQLTLFSFIFMHAHAPAAIAQTKVATLVFGIAAAPARAAGW